MREREEWLSSGRAAQFLGVSTRTLRRYTETGLLPDVRSPGGRRIFRTRDLEAVAARRCNGSHRGVVIYARVSSRRQQTEGDLDRQMTRLREASEGYGPVVGVFSDVASGLSDNRTGLRKALDACREPEVTTLLITHPDRLARFGTGVIEHLLAGWGVKVVAVGEDTESLSAESELVRDMLAVVTSFSGRLYGQRSAQARKVRQAVATEVRAVSGQGGGS